MNTEKKVKVILYCKETSTREIYINELEHLAANYKVADTFSELKEMVKQNRYNGILVDVGTIMRAPKKDRLNFQRLKDLFPVVQLNWNKLEKSIGTLFYGKSSDSDDLESFISRECIPFKPRSIRKEDRRRICLNTIISRETSFKKDVERTVTIDLSKTGCFIYSASNWIIAEKVWFMFKEVGLKTPIKGRIRRIIPWGKSMSLPGIGISFENIDEAQIEQIINMIENSKTKKSNKS